MNFIILHSAKQYNKKYETENVEKIKKRHTEYRETHIEETKEYNKQYNKQYKTENVDKIKVESKKYYEDHKEQIKKYQTDNKEKIKKQRKKYNETQQQNKNYSSINHHIYLTKSNTYSVQFTSKKHSKNFKTIEEAIIYRDNYILENPR